MRLCPAFSPCSALLASLRMSVSAWQQAGVTLCLSRDRRAPALLAAGVNSSSVPAARCRAAFSSFAEPWRVNPLCWCRVSALCAALAGACRGSVRELLEAGSQRACGFPLPELVCQSVPSAFSLLCPCSWSCAPHGAPGGLR